MATNGEPSFDTPNIQRDQAGLLLHSTTRIAAPAPLVFRSLRNTETWKDWNRFVPRVEITYQPPDEDLATAAEIEELVKNTSIAGSYDSDLTDGMADGGKPQQKSSENGDRVSTPPLRLRMNSQASRGSGSEAAGSPPPGTGSDSADHGHRSSGEQRLSAAQRYAASQADRKASVASGAPVQPVHNQLQNASSMSHAAALSRGSPRGSPRASLSIPEIDPTGRRKSKTPSLQKAMKARVASLNLLYGEPSVRLQLNTRMTFFVRMNPYNLREFKQTHFTVTEVSRPDDPVSDGPNVTQLTRAKTHTLNRLSVYRLVWAMDNTMASMTNVKNGSAFPKSLLITERVHEIRPIVLGDGTEECELRTWELQKGPLAKIVKKKYGEYLQKQFEFWGKGLRDFCEALVGKVDRRDFSVVVDENENAVGVITF